MTARGRLVLYPLTRYLIESKRFSQEPLVVVDAGARGGIDDLWSLYGNQARIIAFEPDAKECERLRGRKHSLVEYYPWALSESKGVRTLRLAANGDASSFLETNKVWVDRFPQAALGEIVGSLEVPTVDLDSFAREQGIASIDFLKADVEGAELAVLEGAKGLLANSILGVNVEVFFQPYHRGRPLFEDIDRVLRSYGFVLMDLRDIGRWPRKCAVSRKVQGWYGAGQLVYANAVYLRDVPGEILIRGRSSLSRSGIRFLKLASLAEILGFSDFSLELLQSGIRVGIIEENLGSKLERMLRFAPRHRAAGWVRAAAVNCVPRSYRRWARDFLRSIIP